MRSPRRVASTAGFSAVERRAHNQEAPCDQARAGERIDADFRRGGRLPLVGPRAVSCAMSVA
jgi:hypothetical protein